MVIAYHLIWCAYGWWLPNDPRGSTSKTLRKLDLGDLGPVHFGRKRTQPARTQLKRFFQAASERLEHPMIEFRFDEFEIVASGLARAVEQRITLAGRVP